MLLFSMDSCTSIARKTKRNKLFKTMHHPVVRIYSLKFNVLVFSMLYLNGCYPGFSNINHPCACLHFGQYCWYCFLYFCSSDFPHGLDIDVVLWLFVRMVAVTLHHSQAHLQGRSHTCFLSAKQHTNSCASLKQPWKLKQKLKFAGPKENSFCM